MRAETKEKRGRGVRFRLILSLLAFTAVVVAVLWLLEVVLLDELYRPIKIRSVKNAAAGITQVAPEDLKAYAKKLANEKMICTALYDSDMQLIAGEHVGGECVVHRISSGTITLFYEAALKSEGSAFESYLPANEIEAVLRRSDAARRFFDSFGPNAKHSTDYDAGRTTAYDCVLECLVTHDREGNEIFALLSTVLVPVEPTVSTIRFELNLIIGFLLLLSLGLGYLLSRTISRPLVKLNDASKQLSSGRFDPTGIGGYREVRELSDTLRYAAEEINKVDTLRRELIANVSHDLRTPLTLISGYSEVMRDIPGENTPENLQVIIDEANRLTRLVNDMLDLSKMEAGMDSLNREELDFTELVGSILLRYDKLVEQDGYQILFEKDREEVLVWADRTKLSQVVYNLVNNAIHYGGEDKTVVVRQKVLADSVRLEVTDHGEGIEPDKLGEIWDRYYRVDKNHTSATVGSGLGLSIVKTVLQLHGARYGVESEVGKGSTFWFEIPLDPPSE